MSVTSSQRYRIVRYHCVKLFLCGITFVLPYLVVPTEITLNPFPRTQRICFFAELLKNFFFLLPKTINLHRYFTEFQQMGMPLYQSRYHTGSVQIHIFCIRISILLHFIKGPGIYEILSLYSK